MSRQRSRKAPEGRRFTLEPEGIRDAAQSSEEIDYEGSDVGDKDQDEQELDRLVLGDGMEFMSQLAKENSGSTGGELEDEKTGAMEVDLGSDGLDVEDLDDADLFFLDEGNTRLADDTELPTLVTSEDQNSREGAVWEDSDDDRLVVSLAGNSRLRKLRMRETEDLVTGREYARRLRMQFERLHPTPQWAQLAERPAKRQRRSSDSSQFSNSSDEMQVDDEEMSVQPLSQLLQDANTLVSQSNIEKRTKLRPEVIDIQRTRDVSTSQPSSVTSLSFHPKYPVLLASGPSSTLYLHHVAPNSIPTPNPLLTSVFVRSTPLHSSAFLRPEGGKIFFSGRRRYFHTWDLESGIVQKVTRIYGNKQEQKSMERFKLSPCGQYMGLIGTSRKGGGIVNILDSRTSQWVGAARIEGRGGVADFAWWSDGAGLTIAGKGGEIGEWSLESKSFLSLWIDDGAVGTSVLALGGRSGSLELGGDRWVVIGSSSGVVNIYDRRQWLVNATGAIPQRPTPTRTLMQLTTPTSCLEISPDGQLLVIASRWKKDALRIIHLPSCTVYRNWPTDQTPLGRVSSVAFSSGSDMLAVGNEQGKIRLWEIRV